MITISNWREMEAHFVSVYPNEGCGFIINSKFVPAENVHAEPDNNFRIKNEDYLKVASELEAIVHSHVWPVEKSNVIEGHAYDKRTPSMSDMTGQQSTDLPWGVVSIDGETISDVLWFGLDDPVSLIGRPYILNVYDCYGLVRDYYKTKLGINLRSYPRPPDWQSWDPTLYDANWENEGFRIINTAEELPQVGDLIYFKVISRTHVDHAGIYVGNGRFIHHLVHRLSHEDGLYEKKWDKRIAYWLRHKDVK